MHLLTRTYTCTHVSTLVSYYSSIRFFFRTKARGYTLVYTRYEATTLVVDLDNSFSDRNCGKEYEVRAARANRFTVKSPWSPSSHASSVSLGRAAFPRAPLPLRNRALCTYTHTRSMHDVRRVSVKTVDGGARDGRRTIVFVSPRLLSFLFLSPLLSTPLMAAKQPRSVGHRRNGVTIAQKGTQQARAVEGGKWGRREGERERKRGRTASQPAGEPTSISLSLYVAGTPRLLLERQPAE